MKIRLPGHAAERMYERGASNDEVVEAVEHGERFAARFGRIGFRRNFRFEATRRGRYYRTKQVEVYAVREAGEWIVITVIVRYF